MSKEQDSHADSDQFLREQTHRRRQGRSRRRNVVSIAVLALIGLLILGGPSLISHSSIGRSMITQAIDGYGLDSQIESMRIGWVTPLRLKQLQVRGQSGATELLVERIDADVTVMDLIRGASPTEHVIVRGVRLACQVTDGRCSIEDDIAGLLEGPSSDEITTGHIELTDVTATIKDSITGQIWQLAQASSEIDLTAVELESGQQLARTVAGFTGVLTEAGGSGGTLQGSIEMDSSQWQVSLQSESLPLSVASILRRRFPESAAAFPTVVTGDATGEIVLSSGRDNDTSASIRKLRIRNLTANDNSGSGQRFDEATTPKLLWKNSLATLDGDLLLTETRLIGKRLVATTDFGKASIDGAFSRNFSWTGTADNPLHWLEGIDGVAEVEVDLPKLHASLPGILPIRNGVRLASGRAIASVKSLPVRGPNDIQRSELMLHSDVIRASSGANDVLIDPIDISGIVASKSSGVRAERFQWSSSFGKAIGQGDLKTGSADIEIDFGRLFAMLQPIVDLSDSQLSGIAKGDIRWNATNTGQWRLTGSGDAENLLVTLPTGQRFNRDSINGEVEAVGRWGNQTLQTLSQAVATFNTGRRGADSLMVKAELLQSVQNPDFDVPMPVGIRSSGRLETLYEIASPWLPADLRRTSGEFEASARTEVSSSSLKLSRAHAKVSEAQIAYSDRIFRQQEMTMSLVGELTLPDMKLLADELTIRSDDLDAQAQGRADADEVEIAIQWKANLPGLQGVTSKAFAKNQASNQTITQVSFESDARAFNESHWAMMGVCSGECKVSKDGPWIEISQTTDGQNLSLVKPVANVGTIARSRSPGAAKRATRIVWSEPNLKLGGTVRINAADGTYVANGLEIAGDWFAAAIDGEVQYDDDSMFAKFGGPVRLKMDQVGKLITPLVGTEINLSGVHETPFSVDLKQSFRENSPLELNAKADLGWDSGEVAGVQFGSTRVPIEVTQETISVIPTKIPIKQGFVRASGLVYYNAESPWMQLEPGVIADSIELTPELTERWLKYLAPVVANSAKVKGTLSAQVREAVIVFDNTNQTRVSGQLDIGGAEMSAGPLADQLLGGINQLSSLATLVGGRATNAKAGQTLITMPAQTIDFSVNQGIVSHDRMYFNIDRASVVTSGQVAMDGRLNLTAQVPLDSRWLGRDLQGLAGQSITLPIDGTISRPSVDSSGVSRVATELGAKAIQQTTENYLQKQLERGFEKFLGR
ncbi:hypothetical protein [Rubripirellula obstinata]|uniref:hypothetical protein n=1 Tax=Rubripirellula obstinata TaxID=406547 RepID=UPI00122C76B7|nr:hypothetical protein [Rubripirellula obstinata]